MSKKIFSIIGLILIIIGGLTYYSYANELFIFNNNKLNIEEATQKVENFLTEQLPSSNFTIKEVKEEKGMYRISLSLDDQEMNFYMPLDGSLLFPQSIKITTPKEQDLPTTKKPKVDLFVMSFCPYGNDSEKMMEPVANLLGNKIDLELHYIISATNNNEYCIDEENQYCSLHGAGEVNQNIREICVAKNNPDKLWPFVTAINEQTDAQNVDQDWTEIAQEVGLNTAEIKTCLEKQGPSLLDIEKALIDQKYPVQKPSQHSNQSKIVVQGSPTLVINGMIYDGERSSSGYKEAICSAFEEEPAECEQKLSDANVSSGNCQ